MPIPHEHPRLVRFHDCGHDHRLTAPAALRWFEEIALVQSDALGAGFAFYEKDRVTWVLTEWDVQFRSMPAFLETVTVRTVPQAYRGFAANRQYAIVGSEGEVHVEGRSQWIFVDAERMRPKRISPDLAAVYGMGVADGRLATVGDLADPERADHAANFGVRRGDLDYNGHVNNIRYVEWALETLPPEWTKGRRLTRLRARYRGETKYGAEVRAVACVEGDEVRHRVAEGEREACRLETTWA